MQSQKMNKYNIELNHLYNEIHKCHICPKMDPYKVTRNINAVSLKSDVFIISQALAREQLRLSGINFFNKEGIIGNTGKNLEKFLNKFDRTTYPENEIKLSCDITIPKCLPNYIPVYNTEITQCYPGKNNKGDRPPISSEIYNCISQNFFLNEISLIRPKLLLLMGRISYEIFFKHILNENIEYSLSKYISIIEDSKIPSRVINNIIIYILPIQHASGANPRFSKMIQNKTLIDKIIKCLN